MGGGAEGERGLSRLLAEHGAQPRARSYHPEIPTDIETKSQLNRLRHPGAPR